MHAVDLVEGPANQAIIVMEEQWNTVSRRTVRSNIILMLFAAG